MNCPKCKSNVKDSLNFCPKCGASLKDNSLLNEKKDFVVGQSKNKGKIIAVSVVMMLIAVIGFIYIFNSGKDNQSIAEAKGIVQSGGKIEIPLAELSDGKAHFYKVENVKYFAVKAPDGTVRTAFDACEVCFQAKKGYYKEGNSMVCRNCGKKFNISNLDERQGGCKPIHLKNEVKDGKLIVKTEDILKLKNFF